MGYIGGSHINKKSGTSSVDSLLINDEICSDEILIANAFNDFFSQIGSKVSDSVPPKNSN